MTRFNRSGHFRTNQYGTTFHVRAHQVDRDAWLYNEGGDAAPIRAGSGYLGSFLTPNAHCPVCGEQVWFFENIHGSRVFFDTVWPKWDKHPCTDNGGRALRTTANSRERELVEIDLPEVEIYPRADGFIIALRHHDGRVEFVTGELPLGDVFLPRAYVIRTNAGDPQSLSLQSTRLVPCDVRVKPCDPPGPITRADRLAYGSRLQKKAAEFAKGLPGLEQRWLAKHEAIGTFIAGVAGRSPVYLIPLLFDHYRDENDPFDEKEEATSDFMKRASLTAHRALKDKLGTGLEGGVASQVIFLWEGILADIEEYNSYPGAQGVSSDGTIDMDSMFWFQREELDAARIAEMTMIDLMSPRPIAIGETSATGAMLLQAEDEWVARNWRDTGEGQMKQTFEMARKVGLMELLQLMFSQLHGRGWRPAFAFQMPDGGGTSFPAGDRRVLQFEPFGTSSENRRTMRLLFHLSKRPLGLVFLLDPEERDASVVHRLVSVSSKQEIVGLFRSASKSTESKKKRKMR